MKIKVVSQNREKIDSVIKAVEGQARVRTCDYSDVLDLAFKAEENLKSLGIPRSSWGGITYTYQETVQCNSYGYPVSSTWIRIVAGSRGSGWFLIGCGRGVIFAGRGKNNYRRNLPQPVVDKRVEIYRRELETQTF